MGENQEPSAYSAGWDAHARGEALDDCPYECIDVRYEWWRNGWSRRSEKFRKPATHVSKYPKANPSGDGGGS